ncbi:uncharacterized protein LOC117793570 [Drosophila innubila]|uniref:uncharacterized protein LOC117793570 n=1 Tax=Drosophila innubila TaxID=198719 RepID=UPI00148B7186|nr:uncharacterized protein LOC117793570 [Drosophila innubila]
MENSIEKRGSNGNPNFNNMTDEQLREWHTAFLSEAQRENYVNHNLEIVRHYRTEAISRAPAFDIERNAIDAAIARHGLCVPSGNENSPCPNTEPQLQQPEPVAAQEEEQPPPMRRPRMEQPEQQQNDSDAHCANVSSTSASYGHYVALAHIFSDTYTARAESTASSNVNVNGNNASNNFNDREGSDINDMAITKTIDSLGLRRT